MVEYVEQIFGADLQEVCVLKEAIYEKFIGDIIDFKSNNCLNLIPR